MEMIEMESQGLEAHTKAKAVAIEAAYGLVEVGADLVKEFVPDILKPENKPVPAAPKPPVVVERPVDIAVIRAQIRSVIQSQNQAQVPQAITLA